MQPKKRLDWGFAKNYWNFFPISPILAGRLNGTRGMEKETFGVESHATLSCYRYKLHVNFLMCNFLSLAGASCERGSVLCLIWWHNFLVFHIVVRSTIERMDHRIFSRDCFSTFAAFSPIWIQMQLYSNYFDGVINNFSTHFFERFCTIDMQLVRMGCLGAKVRCSCNNFHVPLTHFHTRDVIPGSFWAPIHTNWVLRSAFRLSNSDRMYSWAGPRKLWIKSPPESQVKNFQTILQKLFIAIIHH